VAKKKQAAARFSQDDLIDVLLTLSPRPIQSVELLRQFRATGEMPADKEEAAEATRDLIAYTDACESFVSRFRSIAPIPARENGLVEGYPL
jgi:hypothetical protein